MKKLVSQLAGLLSVGLLVSAVWAAGMEKDSVYPFKVKTIDGKDTTLGQYKGKTLLIVNVASKCGFTPQYTGLEKLYEKYKGQGFVILGFPCNQFGAQEPGTPGEIKAFCTTKYGVTFPMFSKIEVNGDDADPLYKYLKAAEPDPQGKTDIGWNFTKFLVDRQGHPLKRFVSNITPEEIDPQVGDILKK